MGLRMAGHCQERAARNQCGRQRSWPVEDEKYGSPLAIADRTELTAKPFQRKGKKGGRKDGRTDGRTD